MAAFSNTASLKASSALKEFLISRELNAQRHEMGTGSAQGRPRNMYKRSASESSSAAVYMQGKEHTLPKERHGLLHTLSHRDSNTTGSLAQSDRSLGPRRNPRCSHYTTGSNELGGALS